ncbi:hypothetical protein TUM12370_09570 [Salmonella enterica subsp. enterica serovar Choleraesuis]|nr:hypothetical protein TUM12370_09570 [Salmonella enterica subsp. enterica serovar Choleraesuis]
MKKAHISHKKIIMLPKHGKTEENPCLIPCNRLRDEFVKTVHPDLIRYTVASPDAGPLPVAPLSLAESGDADVKA